MKKYHTVGSFSKKTSMDTDVEERTDADIDAITAGLFSVSVSSKPVARAVATKVPLGEFKPMSEGEQKADAVYIAGLLNSLMERGGVTLEIDDYLTHATAKQLYLLFVELKALQALWQLLMIEHTLVTKTAPIKLYHDEIVQFFAHPGVSEIAGMLDRKSVV